MPFPKTTIALAALMATTVQSAPSALAHEKAPGIINISATGRVTVAPDMAVLSLSVVREAKTARDALDQNTAAMTEVLAAMKAAGIEEKDLQTSNFSIQPRYVYPRPTKEGEQKPPRIVAYTVSNSLTVRVRDLANLGTIMDRAVTLGVNAGGNIRFTTDDPSQAIEEARKKAIQNALSKAKTMTESLGVGLGRIRNISERGGARPPRPVAIAQARASYKAEATPVPVARGENSYAISVTVQWEIDQ